jgi:hypothetical protein
LFKLKKNSILLIFRKQNLLYEVIHSLIF